MEPDHLRQFIDEDGLRPVQVLAEVLPGDIVAYTRANGQVVHVGIVMHKELISTGNSAGVTVLSKWGQDGEYLHAVEDIPANLNVGGAVVPAYWTERIAP